jgi:hypothetical protein
LIEEFLDKDASKINPRFIRTQFRTARSLTSRTIMSAVIPPTIDEPYFAKSYAQVATSVLPQAVIPKSCELKLKSKRPSPLTLRVSENQKAIIRTKAKTAGTSVNHFVLASTLGSDYRPPKDPELVRALMALNRELTAQGNNINQIAHQRNASLITDAQADSMLDILGRSLLRTHTAVRDALSHGMEPKP